MRIIIICATLSCFSSPISFQPCSALVIVVHGSFAPHATWHRPLGEFYDKLELQAFFARHKLISFSWSGIPTHTEITRSARALAKLITSYSPQEEIILIGHSHGGNVVNVASTFLSKPVYTPLDFSLLPPLFDFTMTTRSIMLWEEAPCEPQKKYLIERIYLLGTPVDCKKYMPCMDVIGYLYNFYSSGDLVQPVLGWFGRTYPLHERITNSEIIIKDHKSNKTKKPSHSDLHNLMVAQWILSIPDELKKTKTGNFDLFVPGKNCIIAFQKDSHPLYQPFTT